MKYFIYITLCFVVSFSCSPSSKRERLLLLNTSNGTLNEWVNYYQTLEPSFSLDNFEFKSKHTLEKRQGSVYANYDTAFDAIYSKFLIFNSTEEKYIDFDSYSWVVDEAYTVLFSPDQEINLIDRHNKTVDRIAFRGPSQWVEDAYWQDDTIVVLLENTYGNQPIISKIDLKNKSVNTFIYNDSITIKSDYSKMRYEKISLSYD